MNVFVHRPYQSGYLISVKIDYRPRPFLGLMRCVVCFTQYATAYILKTIAKIPRITHHSLLSAFLHASLTLSMIRLYSPSVIRLSIHNFRRTLEYSLYSFIVIRYSFPSPNAYTSLRSIRHIRYSVRQFHNGILSDLRSECFCGSCNSISSAYLPRCI